MNNSIYIKSAFCKPVDRFPIWMMRQAGRYMKSYQAIRSKYTMLQVMKTPELACQVTLQPIHAFGMDAAILFSDILTIPDAFGLGLEFHDQTGPVILRPIRTIEDVEKLNLDDLLGNLTFVMDAIRLTKKELGNTPLIGFAGAPFTLASYMVGEGRKHDLKQFMEILFKDMKMMHALLDKLADATALYLNAQIKAGVDAIQIFDSWSSVLSWSYFKELALPHLKKVIQKLERPSNLPVTVFGTSYSVFYPLLHELGVEVISIDSRGDLSEIRKNTPSHIALQGNLDPYFLIAPKNILEEQVLNLLDSMRGSTGFIFNLGHGVMPSVPEDNVKRVVELVKNYRV